MNEKIKVLKVEINESIRSIQEAYQALNKASEAELNEDSGIIVSYFLHVIYGYFENTFLLIARAFENQIEDQSQWHTQLLWRMTLNIPDIRPAVIGKESYVCLNELLRFRHLFRNAYLLRFDPERLALVLRDARRLEQLYKDDLNAFLAFLDRLVKEEGLE